MENDPLKATRPPPAMYNEFNDVGYYNCNSEDEEAPDELADVILEDNTVKDAIIETIDNEDVFVCNVCLDPVRDRDPIVTQCGHLYCWPCIFRWLSTHHSTCPVCKAGVSRDNVIPIFIRGSTEDPRKRKQDSESSEAIPTRPLGRRLQPQQPTVGGMAGANMQYSDQFGGMAATGYGFFPSLFALQFQSFPPLPENPDGSISEEQRQETMLSRYLTFLFVLVVVCLVIF